MRARGLAFVKGAVEGVQTRVDLRVGQTAKMRRQTGAAARATRDDVLSSVDDLNNTEAFAIAVTEAQVLSVLSARRKVGVAGVKANVEKSGQELSSQNARDFSSGRIGPSSRNTSRRTTSWQESFNGRCAGE